MDFHINQTYIYAVKDPFNTTQEIKHGAVAAKHTQQKRNIAVMAWSTPFLVLDDR
jgi:hypothetical protein